MQRPPITLMNNKNESLLYDCWRAVAEPRGDELGVATGSVDSVSRGAQ